METKRTPNDMESAYPSQPTLTRFRTKLQDTEIHPLDLYDSKDSETDSEPTHKEKKKRRNKLVAINLLLIIGLGIATTACYIYGIGPWKAVHVRAFYTSSKFMTMECWTAEEQTVSLTWLSQTLDSANNQTQQTREVNDWWRTAHGHSPDIGQCRMNSSCEDKNTDYTYTNRTGMAMIELLAFNHDTVEIRTLKLIQLDTKTASCTWIKVETETPHTYCNWSCIPITKNHRYGYWKRDGTFEAGERNTTCLGFFSSWEPKPGDGYTRKFPQ